MSRTGADKLSEEELEAEYREAFDLFDKNKNNVIELSELASVMRALGQNPSNKALRKMIKDVDQNKNGMIDFEDFKILMANMSYESKEERDNDMMGAFKIFDKDNSGYIDKSELVRIVTSFGEPLNDDEVQSMLNVVDSDKDGKINYNEFVEFINKPVLTSTMGQGKK